MKPATKAIIIVAAIVILAVAGVAVASTLLYSEENVEVNPLPPPSSSVSPTPTPTVTPTTYTLHITANTTQPYMGENVTLTAWITPPIENVPVIFFRNNVAIAGGTVNTNSLGYAILTVPINNVTPKIYNCTALIP